MAFRQFEFSGPRYTATSPSYARSGPATQQQQQQQQAPQQPPPEGQSFAARPPATTRAVPYSHALTLRPAEQRAAPHHGAHPDAAQDNLGGEQQQLPSASADGFGADAHTWA